MYDWMKKLHMWAGLLSFTAFIVWGVAGVEAVFLPPPEGYEPPEVSSEKEIPFDAPGGLDDKALARLIYETVKLPMAGGHYNIHRDDNQHLAFFVFTVNGRRDLTYLEEQKKIRIAYRQNELGGFLSSMHTGHSRRGPPDIPARFWGVYNEFSTWAFLFMSLSGVYLWIASRPGLPWARMCLGGAALLFIVLWVVTR